jgi:lysozyme family protein
MSDTQWHLDKRVPVALLLGLLLQGGGVIWWASGANERLSQIERRLEGFAARSETLDNTVQQQGQTIAVLLSRIDDTNRNLDRLRGEVQDDQQLAAAAYSGAPGLTRFDACVEVIFEREGGFVNHPDDPGGATNMGITIGTLRAWRDAPVTIDDVRNLTKSEARAIYKDRYWDGIADEWRPGVDMVVFDAAVHAGPRSAIGFLQGSIGAVVDGIVGPETRWKASQKDPIDIITDFVDLRLAHLRALKHWPTFGRGWTNRLNAVSEAAIKMARADTGAVSVAGTTQDGRLLRAYRLARGEIGTKEVPGAASNPTIDNWFLSLSPTASKMTPLGALPLWEPCWKPPGCAPRGR